MVTMGSVPVMRRLPALIAVLALAAGASACGEKDESAATEVQVTGATTDDGGGGGGGGGGGESAGQSDEGQIADAVVAVIGGNDPTQVCEKLATVVYVKHSYGDVQGCRAAVAKRGASDVDVTVGKVEAKTAEATATPKGGPSKGETLKVDLILEDGVWKVDVVRSNAPVGP
jgi:hypothetical protein